MRPRGHDGLTIGVAIVGFFCLVFGAFSLANAKAGGGILPLALGGVLLVAAAAAIGFILKQSSFFSG
jgi:hypothetical protein